MCDCKFSDVFSVASSVINIKKPCNLSEAMNVLAFLLGFSNTILQQLIWSYDFVYCSWQCSFLAVNVTNDELNEHVMILTSGDCLWPGHPVSIQLYHSSYV